MNTHIRLTLTTMIIAAVWVAGCSRQPTRAPVVVEVTYDTAETVGVVAADCAGYIISSRVWYGQC